MLLITLATPHHGTLVANNFDFFGDELSSLYWDHFREENEPVNHWLRCLNGLPNLDPPNAHCDGGDLQSRRQTFPKIVAIGLVRPSSLEETYPDDHILPIQSARFDDPNIDDPDLNIRRRYKGTGGALEEFSNCQSDIFAHLAIHYSDCNVEEDPPAGHGLGSVFSVIERELLGHYFFINRFRVLKNDLLLFEDTFDDGQPPPSAPRFADGTDASYGVVGAFGPEVGGKLRIDSSIAAIDPPYVRQLANLITARQPSEPRPGLFINDTFEVIGVFDLVIPSARDSSYGIGFTDSRPTDPGHDTLELVVRRTASGELQVQFRRIDLRTGLETTIAGAPLERGHEQIGFILSRRDTTNNAIFASFAYIDAGEPGPITTFPVSADIFRGNNWTRAAIAARSPLPPPYDNFSSPQIDSSRWTTLEQVREIRDGELYLKIRIGQGNTNTNSLPIADPAAVSSLQADVDLLEYEPGGSSVFARIRVAFYNDGTPGGGSAGNVFGDLRLGGSGITPVAQLRVVKCNDPDCNSQTTFRTENLGTVSLNTTYTLRVTWTGSEAIFNLDGLERTFDPRPFAPPVGPPVGLTGLSTAKTSSAGEGLVAATFDNVFVNGFLYDDFPGPLIDPVRWQREEFVREIQSGKLVSRLRQIGGGALSNSLSFPNPNAIAGIQAEVTVDSFSTSGGGSANARLRGRFYNDGLGDIGATIAIGGRGPTSEIFYIVDRCNVFDCSSSTTLQRVSFGLANLGQAYRLSIEWDGVVFAFSVDDTTDIFDPREVAPVVRPADNPARALSPRKSGTTGGSGSIRATFDNVFIKTTP